MRGVRNRKGRCGQNRKSLYGSGRAVARQRERQVKRNLREGSRQSKSADLSLQWSPEGVNKRVVG